MNWKEFLKPDWRKIVLTIIIFFILGFVFVFFTSCFCPRTSYNTSQCQSYFYLPWDCCPVPHCGNPDLLTLILSKIYSPSIIVVNLIFSYLFSCFFILNITYKISKGNLPIIVIVLIMFLFLVLLYFLGVI